MTSGNPATRSTNEERNAERRAKRAAEKEAAIAQAQADAQLGAPNGQPDPDQFSVDLGAVLAEYQRQNAELTNQTILLTVHKRSNESKIAELTEKLLAAGGTP